MFSFSKHIICLLLKNEMLYKITNNDVLLNFFLPLLVFKTKTIFLNFHITKKQKKNKKKSDGKFVSKKFREKSRTMSISYINKKIILSPTLI